MNEHRESFRKLGLTFEEKAFYDILISLRDEFNFEYGVDVNHDGIMTNDKCKKLAMRIKEIIDEKSSFADWLNNQNVRKKLEFEIQVCLVKNGYPPQYSRTVFIVNDKNYFLCSVRQTGCFDQTFMPVMSSKPLCSFL